MKTLRTLDELADAGLIAAERLPALKAVAARYAVAVTPGMVELIEDAADPIGAQFLPQEAELVQDPLERADPIGDEAHSPAPGVVHRYPDRVLLKLTHTCAVYCRFCFRREMVGPEGHGNMTPAQLDEAMDRLSAIPHVKIVRFHTRIPVVDPAAVTDELVAALKAPGKTTWVALHANHPREMTPAARAACARLVDGGVAMVSQTVLLKGVNDDPETLGALMRAFVETRIKPYYLHQMDLAPGTGHLRTSVEEGQAVMRALRGALSGLCQPTYILDIPDGHGKVPIGPGYLEGGVVEDPSGRARPYPPEG
ncbi:MAG: lysine 2,3-aminomutase YodO family protein [Caulobacter sp.]|nr:lysine 2,3-aminomutase YodO family protein [Caulobacter sp.]